MITQFTLFSLGISIRGHTARGQFFAFIAWIQSFRSVPSLHSGCAVVHTFSSLATPFPPKMVTSSTLQFEILLPTVVEIGIYLGRKKLIDCRCNTRRPLSENSFRLVGTAMTSKAHQHFSPNYFLFLVRKRTRDSRFALFNLKF